MVYVVGGIGLLVAAVLPRLLRGRAISVAMGFTAVGVLVGLLPLPLPEVDPIANGALTERLTEFAVIVAIMGVGLSLDRPLSWKAWRTTWRLLVIGMPLFIVSVAALGYGIMGLLLPSALLLAAVLAPTDPVLAGDVQVGGPNSGEEDEVRFGLTSEAGLNDGLGFPFVYLALFVGASAGVEEWGPRWLAWEFLGKVVVGVVVGAAIGWLLARAAFRAHKPALRFAQAGEAVVALGAVLLAYGAAETLQGYGFLAVFAAAVVIRTHERDHEYHEVLHSFIGQVEQILTMVLLLLFGIACARGLLDALTLSGVVVAALLVLVVRPVAGWIALLGPAPGAACPRVLRRPGRRLVLLPRLRHQPGRVLGGDRAVGDGRVHGSAVGRRPRHDGDARHGLARPGVRGPRPGPRPRGRPGGRGAAGRRAGRGRSQGTGHLRAPARGDARGARAPGQSLTVTPFQNATRSLICDAASLGAG
jgi:NhaP-type Na+/H+ or K+/H+ antiporter